MAEVAKMETVEVGGKNEWQADAIRDSLKEVNYYYRQKEYNVRFEDWCEK